MKDCVSLEIAKKLKALGWKQQGMFWHVAGHNGFDGKKRDYCCGRKKNGCGMGYLGIETYAGWANKERVNSEPDGGGLIYAVTIGELAHALPMDIHIDKLTRDGKECYRVTLTQDEKMDYDTIEGTLADTLGACLVSLMKDGYKPPNS